MAGRGNPSFLKNQKAKKRQERASEKRAARQAKNAEKRAAREAGTDLPELEASGLPEDSGIVETGTSEGAAEGDA